MGTYTLKLNEFFSIQITVATDGTVSTPLMDSWIVDNGTYPVFNSDGNQVGSVTVDEDGNPGKLERLILTEQVKIADDGTVILPEGVALGNGQYVLIDPKSGKAVGEFTVVGGVPGEVELYPVVTGLSLFAYFFGGYEEDREEVEILMPVDQNGETDGFGYGHQLALMEAIRTLLEGGAAYCPECNANHTMEHCGYDPAVLRQQLEMLIKMEREYYTEERLQALLEEADDALVLVVANYSREVLADHLERLQALFAWFDETVIEVKDVGS